MLRSLNIISYQRIFVQCHLAWRRPSGFERTAWRSALLGPVRAVKRWINQKSWVSRKPSQYKNFSYHPWTCHALSCCRIKKLQLQVNVSFPPSQRSWTPQWTIISSYKFIIPLANSLFFCFDKNNFPHLRGSLPPPNLPLWRCQPTFDTSKSIKNPSLNHFWSPEPCRPGLLGEEVGSHQQNSAQNSQAPPASR